MTRPITNWHTEHAEQLTRGQRAADRLRNGMGSWMFIAIFVLFMLAWAVINLTAAAWDPYPYILLNLFLSMLAGLQGAILLIAAKRQDAIAAALAQHDYETNLAAKHEIEELMEINRLQLALLRELHASARPASSDSATT
ncbi:membrane protein [Bacillus toyonensis]|nr:membrane protein [Bacillus toyonensis]